MPVHLGVVRFTYTVAAPIVAVDARCRDVTEDVRWGLTNRRHQMF